MKFNKFFAGLLGALAMTACSSDEPNNSSVTPDDAVFGDSYLSIAIQMPNEGGRATDEYDGNYTDGTAEESQVENVVFFFFDDKNICVDIQMFDKIDFVKETANNNPYVTSFGVKEIRLKSGLSYNKVAVVLNSSADAASDYRATIKTLADLEARAQDYVSQIKADGSHQVMSNSVYYDMADAATKPDPEAKIVLVPIVEDNVYTSAQRADAGIGNLPAGKSYVDVYVERVVARVDVTASIDMEKYYVSMDDATKEKYNYVTIYDNVNLTTKQVTIEPVLLGMTLNVLTPSAKLIKPITTTQVGYGIGDHDNYKDFEWNDPINKRSYWANTTSFDPSKMTYISWEDTKKKGMTKISQYIHPNTQDYAPIAANENSSLNTKVMVVAQLKAKDANGNLSNIDLVRYGSEYMEASGLCAHVANTVNMAVRSINWSNLAEKLTPAQAEILRVAVNNSFVTGTTENMYTIGILSAGDATDDKSVDYEAKISQNDKFAYTVTVDKTLFNDVANADIHAILDNPTALNGLIDIAYEKINKTITDVMADVNMPRILYWKDGMTYYYVNIRQQGFKGLSGKTGDNDYLNGVIRNHIYQVNLTGIYGLGTPVIEPGLPIDPERPEIDRPSYITARINILPWRVVENNATIH